MKYAIITYTSAQNWGGQLQAYSLKEYMNQVGFETDLINFRKLDSRRFKPKKEVKDIIYSLLSIHANKIRINRFIDFRKNYLKLSEPVLETNAELSRLNEVYDCFITGSDQLWNCDTEICYPFYLSFVRDEKKKIAYAPSFGRTEIPQRFKTEVSQLISKYDSISVREKSGAEIIKQLTGKNVQVVVDPVFLHSSEEWTQKLDIRIKSKKYVFVYTTEKSKTIREAVKKFHVEYPDYNIVTAFAIPGVKAKIVKDIGPREFVEYVASADYVIANSFHAIAFSLIYQVPFCAVMHSTRSARVSDLLNELGLKERILQNVSDYSFCFDMNENYKKKLSVFIDSSKKYISDVMR